MTDSSITQIVTFLTLVFVSIMQVYRENRNVKRLQEAETLATLERERVAKELQQTTLNAAETLRREAVRHTERVVAAAKAGQDALAQGITEATEHAKAAYTEANHVNLKIADLNKQLLDQRTGEKHDPKK